MAHTPLTAMPMRRISPLDQGAALMDGKGPFALQQAQQEQAMLAQQQQMAQQEEVSAEEQLLESLKAQKDGLSKSNKVKELALAIEDELQKQAELNARLSETPSAVERLKQLIEEMGL